MTPTAEATTPKSAGTLKAAAWVAFAYAAFMLGHIIMLGMQTDGLESTAYVRRMIDASLFVLIGVGLLRRARWGWFFGLAWTSMILVLAGSDLAISVAYDWKWSDSWFFGLSRRSAAVNAALLAVLLVLLLHPRSRRAIRSATLQESNSPS